MLNDVAIISRLQTVRIYILKTPWSFPGRFLGPDEEYYEFGRVRARSRNRASLPSEADQSKMEDIFTEMNGCIDLKVLVDNYYNKILSFHRWIFSRILDINQAEVQSTWALQEELEILLNEIYES